MVIASIFVFTITAILYFNWGDKAAISGALSTTGSFFGGFATLGAAIIAAHLFNDWRVQHNKEMEIQFISKVMESFNLFDLKITKMFQFDYPAIDVAVRHDVFIRECLILELDVRIIQVRYGDYVSYLGQDIPKSHKKIFTDLRRSINQLKHTEDIRVKRDLIKHRITHDLVEFTNQYDEIIHPTLLQNLKALH